MSAETADQYGVRRLVRQHVRDHVRHVAMQIDAPLDHALHVGFIDLER